MQATFGQCRVAIKMPRSSGETRALTVSQAAERFELHAATVRRLCDEGRIRAKKVEGVWLIESDDLERFLHQRRAAGRTTAGFQLVGAAPNRTARDADGWRIAVLVEGSWLLVEVWLDSSLLALLVHYGYKPLDLVIRGGERLVEEERIKIEDVPRNHQILLAPGDFSRLLRAAGLWAGEYLAGEGPSEEGVVTIYDVGPRDFGGLRLGDSLSRGGGPSIVPEGFIDVVVDWSLSNGRRRMRAVRLPSPGPALRKQLLNVALHTYMDRCERSTLSPAPWSQELREMLGRL
jgi:excisionase family DNA binding protein